MAVLLFIAHYSLIFATFVIRSEICSGHHHKVEPINLNDMKKVTDEDDELCQDDKEIIRENVDAQLEEIEIIAEQLKTHLGEEVPKAKLYEMAINMQQCLLLTDLLNDM